MEKFTALVLLVLLTGCGTTRRYTVPADELEREDATVVPARAPDGRQTWLRADAIERRVGAGPAGIEVEARDPGPALRTAGWTFTGTGLLLGIAGRQLLHGAPRGTYEDALGAALLGIGFLGLGGASLLTGGGLLVAGYLADGPEVGPPPAALAHP